MQQFDQTSKRVQQVLPVEGDCQQLVFEPLVAGVRKAGERIQVNSPKALQSIWQSRDMGMLERINLAIMKKTYACCLLASRSIKSTETASFTNSR